MPRGRVPALALVYKAKAGEPVRLVFGACLRDQFEWEIADLASSSMGILAHVIAMAGMKSQTSLMVYASDLP